MKVKIIDALKEMDEVDYMELAHCLHLAQRIRVMLRTYNKDRNWRKSIREL